MRVILRILAIIYIAYLSICVLLIMPALNFLPAWFVKENYGRQLSGEITYFNPFTLSLEVRHLALPEPNGVPFASLDSATVDLSLESLWQTGWVFDESWCARRDTALEQLEGCSCRPIASHHLG